MGRKQIPDLLYKYRDWNDPFHQRLLKNNEIYLASSAQFNDPFDSSLPFRYNKDELTPDNIFKKLIEVGKKNYPDLSEPELHRMSYERQQSGVFDNDEYWKDFHPDFKKNIEDNIGICSLTTQKDNLLMWSHYARSHQGICVGFNTSKLFDAVGGKLGPVIYSKNYPILGLFDNTLDGLTELINTKSTHWNYEDELRITKIHSARRALPIPEEVITEVIIGCKMGFEAREEIYELLDKKYPHVQLFEAYTDDEKFQLNIYPVTIFKKQ